MTLMVVESDSKHAGEKKLRGFDLTPYSTKFWLPGMIVPAGYAIRPAPRNATQQMIEALGYTPRYGTDGFEYVASVPGGQAVGQSGYREPAFGASPAPDGSLVWTRQPLTAASLFRTIAAPTSIEWIAPTAITISGETSIVGVALQVAAFHAGGTENETHRVIVRVPYSDGSIEDYAIDWEIVDDQVA